MTIRRRVVLCAAIFCFSSLLGVVRADPWNDMDYGSFLTMSVEVAPDNIAYKGIVIRLDPGAGGVAAGEEFVVFDTDTLRYACGWIGEGAIDWRNIAFDGSHGTHPRRVGEALFVNPAGPGWAKPGTDSFDDPRFRGRDGKPYGPLPRAWARWRGLYRHGDRVVLKYTVGGAEVLESPSRTRRDGRRVFVRELEIGPRSTELVLRVGARADGKLTASKTEPDIVEEAAASPETGTEKPLAFDGSTSLEVGDADAFEMTDADFSIVARIRTREGGTIFAKAPPTGSWAPDGKTFFVRGGKLCYDIGWVGVVTSRRTVADGEWHDVLMTYDTVEGLVRIYIDGELDTQRELRPEGREKEETVRIGFTSPNFPSPSAFRGDIAEVAFYQRLVAADELARDAERSRERLVAWWRSADFAAGVVPDASGEERAARRARVGAEGSSEAWVAGTGVVLAEAPAAARLETGAAGELLLRVPAGEETARVVVHYLELGKRVATENENEPALDGTSIASLREPGPAQWGAAIETRVEPFGAADGPFAVEALTPPMDNPHRSWMRLGGFDFFPGGDRAAVCTWMGDVWIVAGLRDESGKLAWKRFAAGLFQPLGLVIREGEIFVLGRDQITRLHDRSGNGEADFYESFNNDAQVTEHFHEFAMDLRADAEGNFYYAKGGRHALDCVVAQHGSILKVSKDGSNTERVAYGLRAPNGLCLNSDGTFLTSDQEGHWTPANRINWVRTGGFYGYMWSYHEGERPETYEPPLCWIHPQMDRSPAEQLWVESASWGALDGKLLAISYGTGLLYHVLHEEVEGVKQGGLVALPVPMFPTGVCRGRFHAEDGMLYLCGLFGWSSNRTLPGGFYRVRRTERPLHAPLALHATRGGIVLRFAEPLDVRRAERTGSYSIQRWNYQWREQYGSKDYRVSDGALGRDDVEVKAVRVAKDGRAVFLEIDDMQPCMQMLTRCRLRAADGTRLSPEIYHTVHALGDPARFEEEFR